MLILILILYTILYYYWQTEGIIFGFSFGELGAALKQSGPAPRSTLPCSTAECRAVQQQYGTVVAQSQYWYHHQYVYSIVQYSIVQYSIVQYSVVQCSVVQCSVVQCSVVQCSVVQYSIVQYSILQYSIVQYIIVQYIISYHSIAYHIIVQHIDRGLQYTTQSHTTHRERQGRLNKRPPMSKLIKSYQGYIKSYCLSCKLLKSYQGYISEV